MVQITGRIEGLPELARNAAKLKKSFASSTLRTALRNAAKPVRTRARNTVDVDSGDLRKAIKSKAKVTRSGFGYADVGYERNSSTAGSCELGTSQQQARPFLRPALEEADQAGEVTDEFIRALNKTIAKQLRKF